MNHGFRCTHSSSDEVNTLKASSRLQTVVVVFDYRACNYGLVLATDLANITSGNRFGVKSKFREKSINNLGL